MTHKTLFNPFPGKNNFSFPQSLVSVCKVVFSVCHNKRPPMIHYIIEDLYILHNSLSQQFLFFTEDCFYCCACRAVTIFCSCCLNLSSVLCYTFGSFRSTEYFCSCIGLCECDLSIGIISSSISAMNFFVYSACLSVPTTAWCCNQLFCYNIL